MTLLSDISTSSESKPDSSSTPENNQSTISNKFLLLSTSMTKLSFGCNDDKLVKKRKLITVCMHGDETCGMTAVNQLITEEFFQQTLSNSTTTTRVTIILANPKGVEAKKRFIDVNLNRIFHEDRLRRKDLEIQPSSPMDSDPLLMTTYEVGLVQNIADEIADCDEYVDIHSTSAGSYPFALPAGDSESEKLACSFAVDFVIEKLVKSVKGTSVGWANILKKKAVCFECGQHQDINTVEVAKKIIKTFINENGEGTTRAVLTCETNQVIRKGFHYVRDPPKAFEKVTCNEILAHDEEAGDIKCTCSSGAYIIMPTANPILGEEAWFWGELKTESKQIEIKKPNTEVTTSSMNPFSIRKSLSRAVQVRS